ncbi:phage protein NinX family protein, partial [Providencia sneebia]
MNKYTELSDFEINLKVSHIALGNGNYDWCPDKKEVYLAGIDGGDFLPHGYFDPCNNPADAMPIIIENGISMVKVNNTWSDRQFNNHCIEINGDNYYRIAMEVYLLMNG